MIDVVKALILSVLVFIASSCTTKRNSQVYVQADELPLSPKIIFMLNESVVLKLEDTQYGRTC